MSATSDKRNDELKQKIAYGEASLVVLSVDNSIYQLILRRDRCDFARIGERDTGIDARMLRYDVASGAAPPDGQKDFSIPFDTVRELTFTDGCIRYCPYPNSGQLAFTLTDGKYRFVTLGDLTAQDMQRMFARCAQVGTLENRQKGHITGDIILSAGQMAEVKFPRAVSLGWLTLLSIAFAAVLLVFNLPYKIGMVLCLIFPIFGVIMCLHGGRDEDDITAHCVIPTAISAISAALFALTHYVPLNIPYALMVCAIVALLCCLPLFFALTRRHSRKAAALLIVLFTLAFAPALTLFINDALDFSAPQVTQAQVRYVGDMFPRAIFRRPSMPLYDVTLPSGEKYTVMMPERMDNDTVTLRSGALKIRTISIT